MTVTCYLCGSFCLWWFWLI